MRIAVRYPEKETSGQDDDWHRATVVRLKTITPKTLVKRHHKSLPILLATGAEILFDGDDLTPYEIDRVEDEWLVLPGSRVSQSKVNVMLKDVELARTYYAGRVVELHKMGMNRSGQKEEEDYSMFNGSKAVVVGRPVGGYIFVRVGVNKQIDEIVVIAENKKSSSSLSSSSSSKRKRNVASSNSKKRGKNNNGEILKKSIDESTDGSGISISSSSISGSDDVKKSNSLLLKLLPKQLREPKREPGTLVGNEYCCFDNDTPAGIAEQLGGDVQAYVALNAIVYVGLKKDSKLQRGTIIMVPKDE
jgi:hypothetical protein